MKTPYNEIVNIASIGSQTNPISLNEILRKANDEQLTPALSIDRCTATYV